jgi:hypothetical protein
VTYTGRAVTLYRLPNDHANWRTIRVIVWGAVVFLLGIAIVSIYEPVELGDSGRRTLAWIAGAIVLSSVLLANVVASRGSLRKLKEGFQFDISDGKIIQTHEGQQSVEIPLTQIVSIREYRGWLVINGGEPSRQITIPSEVDNFEELKRELTAQRAVTTLKSTSRFIGVVQTGLLIVACICLFISHNRAIVMTAGGVVLLLQAFGFYSIWHQRSGVSRPKILVVVGVLLWFVTAWIVYERTIGAM